MRGEWDTDCTMSMVRSQALIHAPPQRVWDLVGDPSRHPEWWPRVIEVRGERYDEGDNYAQVTKEAIGSMETIMEVEQLDELRQINLRCTKTGTYARWLMTEAQGDTFVDVEFGMEPIGIRYRLMDLTVAKPYFRRWLGQSLQALEQAAAEQAAGPPA
jgi:ribosome-associated toxin RatA of RatAB toxin-antitoxin module